MIGTFFIIGRRRVLAVITPMTALIAAADWYVGNKASLGVFYILPMVIGATALSIPAILILAVVCSSLRSLFDIPTPYIEMLLRFIFATLAYACSGLLVAALASVRREQELRREAEEQLKILAESSPAAIFTVDGSGRILAANQATSALFMLPEDQPVRGREIGAFLPVLADAIQFESGPEGLRTAAQCQGRRENGEIFLADTWFSSYMTPEGKRLAAIAVDISEELRDREQENFRQVTVGNRIAAAAVFHEVRNLSSAIGVISSNLRERHGLMDDIDFQALASLATGLEKVASVELQSRVSELPPEVELQAVLDDLRIVIESDWEEIGGVIHWPPSGQGPRVLADRHGLLQAFLNIVHNSRRAVEEAECERKELSIETERAPQKVVVRFRDSGRGVADPDRLFTPFQTGANGAGLGLYVSRAVVRSYGGNLRFEAPGPTSGPGASFAVELLTVDD